MTVDLQTDVRRDVHPVPRDARLAPVRDERTTVVPLASEVRTTFRLCPREPMVRVRSCAEVRLALDHDRRVRLTAHVDRHHRAVLDLSVDLLAGAADLSPGLRDDLGGQLRRVMAADHLVGEGHLHPDLQGLVDCRLLEAVDRPDVLQAHVDPHRVRHRGVRLHRQAARRFSRRTL
jgi:hypothetical protein